LREPSVQHRRSRRHSASNGSEASIIPRKPEYERLVEIYPDRVHLDITSSGMLKVVGALLVLSGALLFLKVAA
jgi:hypothetical protein